MRTVPAAALFSVALLGCGASQPAPAKPATVAVAPIATAPASRAPLFVEYVVIRDAWVQKVMPAESADVQAWATTPESGVAGDYCWDFVPDTKAQAEAGLARAKSGARLGSHEGQQAPEVTAACAKLKSGEVASAVIRAADGSLHVVQKRSVGPDEQERAFRKAKAPELTSKVAAELKTRLRNGAEMRPAIADTVTAVLGDLAASDERRPSPALVEREELKATRLPEAAKTALSSFAETAKTGDIMNDAVVGGGEVVVARAAAGR